MAAPRSVSRPTLTPTARFRPDDAHAEMSLPPLPYRILAAYRIHSTFRHFFAYTDLMSASWDDVLREELPRFLLADDPAAYAEAVVRMAARSEDSHTLVRHDLVDDLWGTASVPFRVRMIDGKPAIVQILDGDDGQSALSAGDVVIGVDGEAIEARMERLRPFVAGSIPQRRAWQLANLALRGPEGTGRFDVAGADGEVRTVPIARGEPRSDDYRYDPTVRFVDDGILYVDLDRLERSGVRELFEEAESADAIIFDVRGYPKGIAWLIASRLTAAGQPVAARFYRRAPMGGYRAWKESLTFEQRVPAPRRGASVFTGPIVALFDERTQSQAEHTCLFLRAASPACTFVGSPSSGTNGDVTTFMVPGGISVRFTGHDVRHPDGEQLQRRGLQPDILVHPTLAGLRAGRGEVLEAAVAHLRGVLATSRRRRAHPARRRPSLVPR